MKKLLFLFSAVVFVSCSGDDDSEITFLEKYDGVMFQKEFLANFVSEVDQTICAISGLACDYKYNYEYFSFQNGNEFLVHARNDYFGLESIDNDVGEENREIVCANFNKNNEDIDILVNTENEFKYREWFLNTDGTKSELYFRFLAVGDSLSITRGHATEIKNYGGSNWQRSLAVIGDVCTN